jgi:ABC-type transporter Mla subunit MlaD
MIGITGLKQIELTGGSNYSAFLSPGDTITAGRSLFDNISDTAEVITMKLVEVIDNLVAITNADNKAKVDTILTSVSNMLHNSEKSIVKTMSNIELITTEFTVASVSIKNILASLDEIIDENRFKNIVRNTDKIVSDISQIDLKQTNTTLIKLNETITNANALLSRVDALVHKNSPDITGLIEELRETIENLNEFSRIISDDPSILLRSRRRD